MTNEPATVWHAFYDVLRSHGMHTMFGNPGSTEQPMLKNFPSDFHYVLGLQESSVVAMADGYSQATRQPVVVSLHTSAGTGNGMGNIMTAFLNKTPLIIIAGQQTREMLLGEPMLANREAETMPKPWVKWAHQPYRALDVPAAVVRAIAIATMPPAGPVYLSIPMDDWDTGFPSGAPLRRTVSTRVAPDPEQLASFATRFSQAKHPALVLGQEVDKSLGWPAAVRLAERLQVPVYQAPLAERAVFPETHPLFKGMLPMARGPLSTALEGFDVVLVIGAEVWRYYPFVAGPIVPAGLKVLQITNDPHDAATALVGDSMLSDARLALEALDSIFATTTNAPASTQRLNTHDSSRLEHPSKKAQSYPMTALDAWSAVAELRPEHAILVQESPSNSADLVRVWPARQPETYFTFASGGLGWNAPAAAGIALAQKHRETNIPTILAIGDGSFHYSVQSVYTAVQQCLKLIYLVPSNGQYAILKEFAVLEKTPNVPALDLPGLDAVAIARAYGCPAYHAESVEKLQEMFAMALKTNGPTLIQFPIDRTLRPLVAQNEAKAPA